MYYKFSYFFMFWGRTWKKSMPNSINICLIQSETDEWLWLMLFSWLNMGWYWINSQLQPHPNSVEPVQKFIWLLLHIIIICLYELCYAFSTNLVPSQTRHHNMTWQHKDNQIQKYIFAHNHPIHPLISKSNLLNMLTYWISQLNQFKIVFWPYF